MTFFPPLPPGHDEAWLYLTGDNLIIAEVVMGLIIDIMILDERTMRWEQI